MATVHRPKRLSIRSESMPEMRVEAGTTWLKFLPATGLSNFQLLQCTLAAVCFLHAADGAMLPAVFKALEETLAKANPQTLGLVAMAEALSHSVAALVWGALADRWSKLPLLAVSTAIWGMITLATALTMGIRTLFIVRTAAGIISAALGPLAQGMVAAVCKPEVRGRIFGFIIGMGYAGHMTGLFLAGSVSHVREIGGWRAPFCIFAFLTVCLSTLLWMMWLEASSGFLSRSTVWRSLLRSSPDREGGGIQTALRDFVADMTNILRRKSFLVLILQGAFASSGVKAMSYMALWFQYQGFGDVASSTIISSMPLGCIVGSLAAGYVADEVAKVYPNHGRIWFGMAVLVLQLLILIAVFLPGITSSATRASFNRFLLLTFVYGAVSVMAYIGAIRPLFTEIVPRHLVCQVIALASAIDGAVSSVSGNALVGVITEQVFGYQSTALRVNEMPEELRQGNSMALAKAIASVTIFSAIATMSAFVMLHCTYAADKAASERENLEREAASSAIIEEDEESGEEGTPQKLPVKPTSYGAA